MIKACAVCGGEFEARMVDGRSAHHVVTCSEECRRERKLARKRTDYVKKRGDLPDRECRVCGVAFSPRSNAITCSETCADENKRLRSRRKYECTYVPAKARVCVICDKEFRPHGKQKTCSDKCSRALKLDADRSRRRTKRAANPIICQCAQCGSSFEAKRSHKTYCSPKCEYDANADIKRFRCRDWRRRNPEKQKAASMTWRQNNRERHLAAVRRRTNKWRADHPGAKAAESREFRRKYPEKVRDYRSLRTSAYRLARAIEKHGVAALDPAFSPPAPDDRTQKQRDAVRRWKARNPFYKRPDMPREKRREIQRKHHARESAAVKLVRELQQKGLEALL